MIALLVFHMLVILDAIVGVAMFALDLLDELWM
jgi:hypothetical protein